MPVLIFPRHHRLRLSARGMMRSLFLALSLAVILGCEKDEIRHYQAARLEVPPEVAAQAAPTPAWMITAIFPHKDRTWFFKLTGAPEEVEKYQDEYEHFIQSVRFTKKGDPPVTYTVPQGWQRGPADPFRFPPFRFASKPNPFDSTVTPPRHEPDTILA